MGNEISKEERLKLLFEKEMDCTRRCLKTVCISAFSRAFGNDWFGIFKNDDIEFGRKAKNQGFVIGRGKKNAEYCESFGEFDFQAMVKIIAYRKEKYGDAICKHYNLSKADYQNINNYAIDLLQSRNSKSHENDTKLTPEKMEQGVDRMRSLVYYFPNVLDDNNRNTTFKDEMERAYTEYRKSVATKFFRFDECFYKEIKAYTEEIFLECAEELNFKVVKTPGESGFYSYNVEQDKAALLNAVATKYAEITQKRKSDKIESDNSNIDVSDDKTDDKVGANDAISKADNDTSQITNKINPRYLIIGVLSVCLVLLSSFCISKYYVNRQSEKDSAPLKDYNVTLDSFSLTFSNDVEYSKFNDFGNSGELRQLYTTEDVNKNILGDNIVLNSVVDSKIGDETKFVAAKSIDDTKNTWTSDIINVKDGDVYTVCMYIVNDNPNGLKAIAENVKANLSLPTTVSRLKRASYRVCRNNRQKYRTAPAF